MSKILVINADNQQKSIKKYILNSYIKEVDEKFVSSEDYEKYTHEETPLYIDYGYDYVVIYSPSSDRNIYVNSTNAIIHIIDRRHPFILTDNKEEIQAIYFSQNNTQEIYRFSQNFFQKLQRIDFQNFDFPNNLQFFYEIEKSLSSNGQINEEISLDVFGENNIFKGHKSKYSVAIKGKASTNNISGYIEDDIFLALEGATKNKFYGKDGNDILRAKGEAQYNIFYGNNGKDELTADDNAHHNVFYGGSGESWLSIIDKISVRLIGSAYGLTIDDHLYADDNAHHNVFYGDTGNDSLVAFGSSNKNKFYGDSGQDVLVAQDNSNYNELFGGSDDDSLVIKGHAYQNTLYGDAGNDKHYVREFAVNNKVFGGNGNDIIILADYTKNNQLFGGDDEDKFYISDHVQGNKCFGEGDIDHFIIKGDAKSNYVDGGEGDDVFSIFEKAESNGLLGGNGRDEFQMYGNTQKNFINGGADDDVFSVRHNASHNEIIGEHGKDTFFITDYGSYNNLDGGEGNDKLKLSGKCHNNSFYGGPDSDILHVYGYSYDNIIEGGEGAEDCHVFNNANNNIVRGGHGSDIIQAYEYASHNLLEGGEGDDQLLSLARNSLFGGPDEDFLLTFIPDMYNSSYDIKMDGGGHDDILIGSINSWYFDEEKEKSQVTKWIINGDQGDDIVAPYVQSKNFHTPLFYLNAQKDILDKLSQMTIREFRQSDKLLNCEYSVILGGGRDTLIMSSQLAYNVRSNIKDFDIREDGFAFDNKEMADVFLSTLYFAQNLEAATVNIEYEGHLYEFDLGIGKQKEIRLETDKDSYGIEIIYPKWDIGENEEKITYGRYESENLVSKLSKREDFIKSEQFIYRNEVNKDIYVSTNQTINLKADLDRNIKIHWQSMNIDTGFVPKFFFTDEDNRTKLYEDLASNENNCAYIGSDIPKNLISIIVLQEDSRGIDFTIKSEEEKLFSETKDKEDQVLNCYSAIDFFTKGHFRRSQHIDNMSGSLNMRLGLVLQGQNGQIITTPMSDKIEVRMTH